MHQNILGTKTKHSRLGYPTLQESGPAQVKQQPSVQAGDTSPIQSYHSPHFSGQLWVKKPSGSLWLRCSGAQSFQFFFTKQESQNKKTPLQYAQGIRRLEGSLHQGKSAFILSGCISYTQSLCAILLEMTGPFLPYLSHKTPGSPHNSTQN